MNPNSDACVVISREVAVYALVHVPKLFVVIQHLSVCYFVNLSKRFLLLGLAIRGCSEVGSRVVFVGREAGDFPGHWFYSSLPLVRNLPSQPGKPSFLVSDQNCIALFTNSTVSIVPVDSLIMQCDSSS